MLCDTRRRQNIELGLTFVKGVPLTDQENDGLSAILGVDVYLQLTAGRGWSPRRYTSWAADVIDKLLG